MSNMAEVINHGKFFVEIASPFFSMCSPLKTPFAYGQGFIAVMQGSSDIYSANDKRETAFALAKAAKGISDFAGSHLQNRTWMIANCAMDLLASCHKICEAQEKAPYIETFVLSCSQLLSLAGHPQWMLLAYATQALFHIAQAYQAYKAEQKAGDPSYARPARAAAKMGMAAIRSYQAFQTYEQWRKLQEIHEMGKLFSHILKQANTKKLVAPEVPRLPRIVENHPIHSMTPSSRRMDAVPEELEKILHRQGYDIDQLIGKGAQGEVYKIVNKKTGECKVLKIMRSFLPLFSPSQSPEYGSHLAHTIDHPAINTPEQIFYRKGGKDTLCQIAEVLPYIKGNTLADSKDVIKTMSTRELFTFAQKLWDLLTVLHSEHLVHDDLHVKNVLLDENKNPVLIDMGFLSNKISPLRDHVRFISVLLHLIDDCNSIKQRNFLFSCIDGEPLLLRLLKNPANYTVYEKPLEQLLSTLLQQCIDHAEVISQQ